ncbi:MAG: hypothetical protein HUU38_25345 [Anaerolineales bacterium]|nr:hypothetical protein [Anaerolineales bacterium]
MRKALSILSLFMLFLIHSVSPAQADLTCTQFWNPIPIPGNFGIVCTDEVGGGTIDPGGEGDPGGGGCTPGTVQVTTITVGGDALCEVWEIWFDPCTGQILYSNLISVIEGGSCTAPPPHGDENPPNPCTTLIITPSGVSCETGWGLEVLLAANVSFPDTFLDLRPFPVTLVRWLSAARNGGTPPASGSGSLDYISYGGGIEDDPEVGDWQDVTLTLQLLPATPVMYFTMQTLGTFALPDVGPSGAPITFQFEQPSHPAAGASTTAGQAGLTDLEPEMPLFSGTAQSAYRLFWNLAYEEYKRDCKPGPDPANGTFTCRTSGQAPKDDGHWEYEWDPQSTGGEITPDMVNGLPPSLSADLDGNGTPDAYWNHQVIIRRMDEANSVTNPEWQGSWTWGGVIYWGVREGQGQIGFP